MCWRKYLCCCCCRRRNTEPPPPWHEDDDLHVPRFEMHDIPTPPPPPFGSRPVERVGCRLAGHRYRNESPNPSPRRVPGWMGAPYSPPYGPDSRIEARYGDPFAQRVNISIPSGEWGEILVSLCEHTLGLRLRPSSSSNSDESGSSSPLHNFLCKQPHQEIVTKK